MAENDRFEKHLGAGWRTAANYAEGEKASVEEIGDKIVESLVNYLRDYNGVPSFQEIVLVLKAPVGPSPTEHFSTLEDIVRDQKGHRHTKVAANEAMSLLVISRKLEPVDVKVRLAQAICSALVKHYFFARVCPKMTATERFSDHREYSEWQDGIEHSIQSRIERIATQLAGNPDAGMLRAPRKTTKKVTTYDLLYEVLV